MKNSLRMFTIACIFLCLGSIVKADFARFRDTGLVDGIGVDVDSNGDAIGFKRQNSFKRFRIFKVDSDGNAVNAFGGGDVNVSFANSASASTTTTVNVDGFSSFHSSESIIKVDNNDNIVLAVACELSGGDRAIVVVKILGASGDVDPDSVTVLDPQDAGGANPSGSFGSLDDLIIDSTNRLVVVSHESNGGNSFPCVHRFDGGAPVTVSLESLVTAASSGNSLAVDGSDNIYVAGEEGSEMFIVRLQVADLSVDTSFGNLGIQDAGMGINSSSPMFLSYYSSNLYVTALDTSNNFRIQLVGTNGSLGSSLSTSPFPSAVVLKSVVQRTSDGSFYVGGTIDDSGQTTFLGRLSVAGIGDASYADSGFTDTAETAYLVDGIVSVLPTSAWHTDSGEGGWLGLDNTTGIVAVSFEEIDAGLTSEANVIVFYVPGEEAPAPPDPVVPSIVATVAAKEAAHEARRDRGFKHVAVSGSNLTGIEDGGVVATKFDDVVSYFRSNHSFIITKMTEQGGVDTTFGENNSGVREIRVKSSSADESSVVVANFTGMADVPSYMATDSSNNILIAFKATVSGGGVAQIGVMRLKATDGTIDTTFGSSGLILLDADSTASPEGLFVDSSTGADRYVLLTYLETGDDKTAKVYRYTAVGVADTSFNGSGSISLVASLTNAVPGFTGCVDKDGNVYVGGLSTDNNVNYKLYCLKVTAAGAIDATFNAESGIFESDAAVDDLESTDNTNVFMSVYQVDEGDENYVQNLQIVAQKKNSDPGVYIQQLNINGTVDTVFAETTGAVSVDIEGMNSLNDAERDVAGHLFCGGTLTEDAVKKTFLARFTEDGALDTTYGDSIIDVGDLPDGVKTGMAVLPPTDTWTTEDGGFFFIDSGDGIPVSWIESKDTSRQLRVVRLMGNNDLELDATTASAGAGFELFNLVNFFNSVERMHAYLAVNGIIDTVRQLWLADGSPLTPAEVEIGVGFLDDAIRIMLNQIVTSAANNEFGIPFAMQPKNGPQQAEMQALMVKVEAAFSEAQMNFMDTGVNTAFATFESRLSAVFEKITGKKLKTRLTVPA